MTLKIYNSALTFLFSTNHLIRKLNIFTIFIVLTNPILANQPFCTLNDVFLFEKIYFSNPSLSNDLLHPDSLVNYFGLNETYAAGLLPNCSNIESSYQDEFIQKDDSYFTINRTWTITNTINGNSKTIVQELSNLPNNDTISGFFWPKNIEIEDYRLDPIQLEKISNIDHGNTMPLIQNNTNYNIKYLDHLNPISENEVLVNRIWKINDGYISYIYFQNITINTENFQNLVTFNTTHGKPVSNVLINGEYTSNEIGALLFTDSINNLEYHGNGMYGTNVVDLQKVIAHILGLDSNNKIDQFSSDINKDQIIDILDVLKIRSFILESNLPNEQDWKFINISTKFPEIIRPKAHYITYLLGDSDNSGFQHDIFDQSQLYIEDILLNKGQNYTIPIEIGKKLSTDGVEIHLQFDSSKVQILDISSTEFEDDLDWIYTDSGMLNILISKNISQLFELENTFLEVKIYAKENSLLNLALDYNHDSFASNENNNLILIKTILEDKIDKTSVNNVFNQLIIYPNPASKNIIIDVSKLDIKGNYEFSIFDLDGKLISNTQNQSQVNISNLTNGIYFYKVQFDDLIYWDKLEILH